LLASRVLVIGAGGLGSAAALYLAGAGVGRLTIVDDDNVDLSNLQRQILHRQADIGRAKVESARDTLTAFNPDIRVDTVARRVDRERLVQLASEADLIIDGSDNFATRFAANEASVKTRTPLVSGAAIRMEGQVSVFLPDRPDSPCYRCLFHDGEEPDQTCADNGVLAPVVGIIGSIQALEAIKVLLDLGDPLCGRLLVFDALYHDWRSVRLHKDPLCPVCGE
jgi:adenylyltransferase/sulfurtransferase